MPSIESLQRVSPTTKNQEHALLFDSKIPQVRILSPRCDNKPVSDWILSHPPKAAFLLSGDSEANLRRIAALKTARNRPCTVDTDRHGLKTSETAAPETPPYEARGVYP